jgi:hypothetical protein
VKAVSNAIRAADDFVRRGIPEKIRERALTFAPPPLSR